MTPPNSEADARIAIDYLLRAAGWDPATSRGSPRRSWPCLRPDRVRSSTALGRPPSRPTRPSMTSERRPGRSVPSAPLALRATRLAGFPCPARCALPAITSWPAWRAAPWCPPSATAPGASSARTAAEAARARRCSSLVHEFQWRIQRRFRDCLGAVVRSVFLWDDFHYRYIISNLIGIAAPNGFDTTRPPKNLTT